MESASLLLPQTAAQPNYGSTDFISRQEETRVDAEAQYATTSSAVNDEVNHVTESGIAIDSEEGAEVNNFPRLPLPANSWRITRANQYLDAVFLLNLTIVLLQVIAHATEVDKKHKTLEYSVMGVDAVISVALIGYAIHLLVQEYSPRNTVLEHV